MTKEEINQSKYFDPFTRMIGLEEEELRRPMRRRDCDEVTAQFFSVLRRAWEEGSLIIYGRSDDIYV